LLLLLSSGARLNEALSARWENINREHRVWRIPVSNSKSKRMRLIPLNNSAMEVLDSLDTEGTYEHLFVNKQRSEKLGKEVRYTTITKVWDRIRNEAGIPHFRIHDSRHLFCSWLVSSGVPIYTVMSLAGHADVKTTSRYAHLSTKALQDASASASIMIQGAMHGQIQSVSQADLLPSGVLQSDVLDVLPVA
jgi:integrase